MESVNNVNLILHAHLPYVRHLEYPRFLEEDWFFESLNESYIPLLRTLTELAAKGVNYKIAICFSPTLLTMLQDEMLKRRFINYMNLHIELGENEEKRLSGKSENANMKKLASIYLKSLKDNLAYFEEHNNSIISEIKKLWNDGHLELFTTAATHAYLPLYREFPTAIRSQVIVGIETFEEVFGFRPDGFWLPECGYYPGLDEVLSRYGIRWCQIASHAVISSRDKSLYGGYKPIRLPSGLYAFARDWNITSLVWSDRSGYPCDGDYREFYRDIGYDLPLDYIRKYIHEPEVRVFTGFKYYAITGRENDKREYDIEKAMNKLSLHVDNFIYHIKRNGLMLSGLNVENPVFNLCFDQELFGHRWFEGIAFLREFLIRSSKDDKIRLTTPSENLKDPSIGYEKLYINESSWGSGGYSDVWLDDTNIWVYRHIHKAIERMEELTQRFPSQGSLKGRFLNQASREVLLAMSSDWPYILHDRTSVTYAEKRIRNHLGSFNVVYSAMCKNTVNTEWLIKAERRNAIFPNIDYNIFNPMK